MRFICVPRAVFPTMLFTAAVLMPGCATDNAPEVRSAGCRMNSVLYCDVDAHLGMSPEKCRCVRDSQLRNVLQHLSRR